MRIKYGDIWLTGTEGDASWTAAQGVRVNGSRVVQSEHFLRAAARTFFPRGGRSLRLEFNVGRQFESGEAAEAFMLTHFQQLPEQADVEIHLQSAPGGPVAIATMEDAVLSAVPIGPREGVWLGSIAYTIEGGTISGISYQPQPEPIVRAGSAAIPSGVDTLALTGLSSLGAVPTQILCTVRKPAAADYNLVATVVDGSVTETGFTVELSGTTDKTGYKLDYLRLL